MLKKPMTRLVVFTSLVALPLLHANSAHAFIQIVIQKGAAVATVSGGDGGPGVVAEAGGVNYCWSLPVANLVPTSHSNAEITAALGDALNIIGGVSMTTSQSVPLDASGDYTDPQLCFGGTGLGTGAAGGQLQILGQSIDLSGSENLSYLPTGAFGAQPVSGQTTGHVTVVIKD